MRDVSVRRVFRDSSARVQHESAPAEQDAKALVSARRVRDDRAPALPEYDGRERNRDADADKRYQRPSHGRLHLNGVLCYCVVFTTKNIIYLRCIV